MGTFNALDSPRFTFRGTAFVVGNGNLVVTNMHVLPDAGVAPAPQLAVLALRSDGTREPRAATVVRQDRIHDLVLLRIDGAPLQPLQLADTGHGLREGAEIALIGFPIGGVLGFSPVTHRGILASITSIALPAPTAQRLTDTSVLARLREGPFPVYQLDATAYPGNSGGPLLDPRDGQVLGVINMVLVRSTRESALSNPTGITYAIPSQFVIELLKQP